MSAPRAYENSAIVARYTAVPTSGRIISGSRHVDREALAVEEQPLQRHGERDRDERDDEHRDDQHDRLGPEHRQTLGHGGQAGPDHAGAVLAGDGERTQHGDGQLGERHGDAQRVQRVAGGALGRAALLRAGDVDERQADQDDQADGGDQEDRQGPGGRADRPELDPLAAQQVAEAELVAPSSGVAWRWGSVATAVLIGRPLRWSWQRRGRRRAGTPRRGARPSGTRRTRTSGTCRRPRGSPAAA